MEYKMWWKVGGALFLTSTLWIYGLGRYEADMIISFRLYSIIVFMMSLCAGLVFGQSLDGILDDEKRNIIGGKR